MCIHIYIHIYIYIYTVVIKDFRITKTFVINGGLKKQKYNIHEQRLSDNKDVTSATCFDTSINKHASVSQTNEQNTLKHVTKH